MENHLLYFCLRYKHKVMKVFSDHVRWLQIKLQNVFFLLLFFLEQKSMASSKPKGFKSWTMATPIRKADNIMSSKAAERGEKGFSPSFEKVKQKCNFFC